MVHDDSKSVKTVHRITFTAGVPSNGDAHIFLMWDGSLNEGFIEQVGNRRMLVTFDLKAPCGPQRIEVPAEGGKIVGFTGLTDRGRV